METKKAFSPSKLCYELLKHHEGCKLVAYQCSAKKWTIGFGNTYYPDGRSVKQGDTITQAQADEYLPLILNTYAISVYQALKAYVRQYQYDALVCMCYNIGIRAFEQSTLLKLINKGSSITLIEAEFLKWNKAGGKPIAGLTNRRKSEFHLYSTGQIKFFN